jgi:hypothetical protein
LRRKAWKNSRSQSGNASQGSASAAEKETEPLEAELASTFVRVLATYLGEDGHAYKELPVRRSMVDCLVETVPEAGRRARPLFGLEFKGSTGVQQKKRVEALGQMVAYERNLALRDVAQRLALAEDESEDGLVNTEETLCLPWVTISLSNTKLRIDLMLIGNFKFRRISFVCHLWTEEISIKKKAEALLPRPECVDALAKVLRTVKHWCASAKNGGPALALTRVQPDGGDLKEEFKKRWEGKTVLRLAKSALQGLVDDDSWKTIGGWQEADVAVKHFRAKANLGRPGFKEGLKNCSAVSRRAEGFQFMDAWVIVDVFDIQLVIYPWVEGLHRPTKVGHLLGGVLRLQQLHAHAEKWVHGDVRGYNILFRQTEAAAERGGQEERGGEGVGREREQKQPLQLRTRENAARAMTILLDFDFARPTEPSAPTYPDGYNHDLPDVVRHRDARADKRMEAKHDAFALASIFAKWAPGPSADREALTHAWRACLEELEGGNLCSRALGDASAAPGGGARGK